MRNKKTKCPTQSKIENSLRRAHLRHTALNLGAYGHHHPKHYSRLDCLPAPAVTYGVPQPQIPESSCLLYAQKNKKKTKAPYERSWAARRKAALTSEAAQEELLRACY